jgi:hypothetical protein
MNNRKTLRKILLVILFPACLIFLCAASISDLLEIAFYDECEGNAGKFLREIKKGLLGS